MLFFPVIEPLMTYFVSPLNTVITAKPEKVVEMIRHTLQYIFKKYKNVMKTRQCVLRLQVYIDLVQYSQLRGIKINFD